MKAYVHTIAGTYEVPDVNSLMTNTTTGVVSIVRGEGQASRVVGAVILGENTFVFLGDEMPELVEG